MTTSDWVVAVLTTFLVVATVYYAWQTRKAVAQTQEMIYEMRLSREVAVRPKIVPSVQILGPTSLYPRVANLGGGPAIDVQVSVALEPEGPSTDYRAPYMRPGHAAGVMLIGDKGKMTAFEDYEPFTTFRILGECSDALGNRFNIDEVFELKDYITKLMSKAWARLPTERRSGEPLELIADSLANIESFMRMDRELP